VADRTIKVLTPATSVSFLTLAEAKLLLGSSSAVTDPQLQMMIDVHSATVMRLCNRIFAREEVQDTWRDVGGRRVFTSHWPVTAADVESVYSGGNPLAPGDYELEEGSGKISVFNGSWAEPVVVTYWGGYVLPDEAPLPLKQATSLLVRETKIQASIESTAGIRSLSFRDRRVMFFDPSKILSSAGPGGKSMAAQAAANLLVHYTRWEV